VFVGFEVVSKVTSKLHTPLMSGANAIHGIILVGAIIVAGQASDPWVLGIALLAVVLATVNLVGGFVVTDRMLEMFSGHRRTHKPAQSGAAKSGGSAAGGSTGQADAGGGHPRKGASGGATGDPR
jgi:NAD(P) transhydrogenase subunit alpha